MPADEDPNGQVVDRLRSCYRSAWNLPGLGTVAGQYYFVPEGTPSFKESYLHSKNWHDQRKETEPEFGEVWAEAQGWRIGNSPNGECFEPEISTCSVFPKVPKYYRVKLEGVANGTCPDCALMNNEQILENFPDTCRWASPNFPFCTGANIRFVLDLVATNPNQTRLMVFGLGGGLPTVKAEWFGKTSDWLPFGTNVIGNPSPPTGHCINWPDEVTITPWE